MTPTTPLPVDPKVDPAAAPKAVAPTPVAPPVKKTFGAQDVVDGLVKRGMAPHVAEGFALNAADESGFNPTAVGDNGNAYGLFQWNGPRMRALKSYAASQGKPMSDTDMQLDFAMTELNGSHKNEWSRIQKATDRASAAVAVLKLFERPEISHQNRREAKYLGGLVPRGEYTGPLGGDPSGPSGSGTAPAAPARLSMLTDTSSVNGMDISKVGTIQGESSVSDRERAAAIREAAKAVPQRGTLMEAAGAAIDEQWIATNMLRQFGKEEFAQDDNFIRTGYNKELWDEVSKYLPPEYQEGLNDATSPAHARAISASLRESLARDQKLAQWGWTGVGLQLGAGLLDPVAIGISAITEGASAPLIYGAKATKLSRALRAGAVAAGTNMAVDSYLISQDPTGDWNNLAYSAAAGFLMGGAMGALRKSPVDAEFTKQLKAVEARDGQIEPPTAAPVRNDGNLSAASTGLPTEKTDVQKALDIVGDAPTAVAGGWRIDLVGRLKTSENPIMRWVAERLDEDGVGNKKGTVTVTSAMEIKHRTLKQTRTAFYKEHEPAFAEWAKANGKTLRAKFDPAVRSEFNSLVGKATRNEVDATTDPLVRRSAAAAKAQYAKLLQVGKDSGIKGFDDLQVNDLYLNRQWNVQSIDDFIESYNGGARGADSAGPLHQMLAESMISGSRKFKLNNPAKAGSLEVLEYEDALALSKALVTSVRGRKYQGADIERALAGHNLEALEEMLMDAGIPTNQTADIISKLSRPKDVNSGKLGLARQRIILDENMGPTSSGLQLSDFLENDIEALFGDYAQSVLGEAAYQDVFRSLRLPDVNGQISELQAPNFEAVKNLIKQADKRPTGVVNEELRGLDVLYKTLKGIPLDENTRWSDNMRRLRSWNFLRLMGQVGVAQTAEFGMVLGNGGLRGMFMHMPSLRDFVLRAKSGHVDEIFHGEIENMFSSGMDVLAHAGHSRLDDGSAVSSRVRGGKATKMQMFDHTLNSAKHTVSTMSGMTHINRALQRLNARTLVQRFVDEAHGYKGLVSRKGITAKRYESLGINADMAARINKQILSKVKTRDGAFGKKVSFLDIENWDDVGAKNAFINGVDRWSRRAVQENSAGTMPAFMSKEMGKTIGQFRTFMLGAYTKQLLAGGNLRDWETFSAFLGSMVFGGLFYMAQTTVNAQGRSDKKKFLEERLSLDSIAKAGFQRAGASSFIPMLADGVAYPLTGEAFFNYRTTDLSTGLWGNPSADFGNNLFKFMGGVSRAAISPNYNFSQQDAKAGASLLAFQNAFVIRNLLAITMGNLPKYSQ